MMTPTEGELILKHLEFARRFYLEQAVKKDFYQRMYDENIKIAKEIRDYIEKWV